MAGSKTFNKTVKYPFNRMKNDDIEKNKPNSLKIPQRWVPLDPLQPNYQLPKL